MPVYWLGANERGDLIAMSKAVTMSSLSLQPSVPESVVCLILGPDSFPKSLP